MDKNGFDGLALLHDLAPFLPVDRLHALLVGQPIPTEIEGSALFADISGFTALAERLSRELGQERGAEELNTQVNYTFVGLIDATDRYRGSVLRFSGDALTVWFAGPNHAARAVTAALAMQAVMSAVAAVLPDLRLKVGIGSGLGRRFLPGDPSMGVFDVLIGPAITRMAEAEGLAEPGRIVICPETARAVAGQFTLRPLLDGHQIILPTIFASAPSESGRWPSIRWLNHIDRAWELVDACRPYLPVPIYERLEGGSGGYIADQRLASPLFVRFTGLDDAAPDAAQKLDEMVRHAQDIVARHGGFLNEVGVDDKGSLLVALFGAPIAQENPALRAAQAALALRGSLPHVQSVSCGLTCDRLFAATVGSPMRRAYAIIGDSVNLAARLMSQARPDEILADARACEMAHEVAWTPLDPIRVKGKIAPVRVYSLLDKAIQPDLPTSTPAGFVSRAREMEALQWVLDATRIRQTRTLIMQGQPGLGKSHLLGEFIGMLQANGITALIGSGRSIEQQVPYHTWRDIFSAFFDLGRIAGQAAQREAVLARVASVAPEMVDNFPLLNDVLPLGIPETNLTRALEPAQRHGVLVRLLITLLQAWLAEDGLAIILDNAQWLDALSWDLADRIAHEITHRPLALLIALRPFDTEPPQEFKAIQEQDNTRRLELQKLDAENCALLAAEQLGVGSLPDPIAQIIMQKTGGNPLFIKEIITVLVESGIIRVAGGEVEITGDPANLQLPDNIEGVVRNRIDHLPPDQQTLLKVAAVLGLQFECRALREIQPLSLDDKTLRANLEALEALDLVRLGGTSEDEAVYGFRYAITRDVAYHTLSFSQRRKIHQAIAQWYEQEHAGNLSAYYPLLAHHWREAESPDKELHYVLLAGYQAAAQYANEDAIRHLRRALELPQLTDQAVIYDLLLRLQNLYHLRGEREPQLDALHRLSDLAEATGNDAWIATTGIAWARYQASVAAYPECIEAAVSAFEAAERLHDIRLMAQASIYRGLGLMHLGELEEASIHLLQPLASDDPEIDAWRLDVLGLTLSQMKLFQEAEEIYVRALAKARSSNNRPALARVLHHQGDNYAARGEYEQAKALYSEALTIRKATGDRQGAAETLSCLGTVALETGNYEEALYYLEATGEDFRATADREGQAATLNAMGRLSFERGEYDAARTYLREALAIRRAIGNRQGISITLMNLGLVEAFVGNVLEAEKLFGESLATDQSLGQSTLAASQFAGWGLAAFKQGNREVALAHIHSALEVIEYYGLAQLPYPFTISLICVDVLSAYGQHIRARSILESAYDLLIERADQILEPERRARYLLTIPTHRQIMALYEETGPRH